MRDYLLESLYVGIIEEAKTDIPKNIDTSILKNIKHIDDWINIDKDLLMKLLKVRNIGQLKTEDNINKMIYISNLLFKDVLTQRSKYKLGIGDDVKSNEYASIEQGINTLKGVVKRCIDIFKTLKNNPNNQDIKTFITEMGKFHNQYRNNEGKTLDKFNNEHSKIVFIILSRILYNIDIPIVYTHIGQKPATRDEIINKNLRKDPDFIGNPVYPLHLFDYLFIEHLLNTAKDSGQISKEVYKQLISGFIHNEKQLKDYVKDVNLILSEPIQQAQKLAKMRDPQALNPLKSGQTPIHQDPRFNISD